MKVGPAAIWLERTPPNGGTALSTKLDPVAGDDLLDGVRVFERLEVHALGAAHIRCISRQREHRSDGHGEVGWEGVRPP